MILLFLLPLTLSASFLLCFMSIRINTINSVILNAPIGIFECSIPSLEDNKVYYFKNKIEPLYESYLSNSIKNVADSYTCKYRYYDISDLGLEEDYPTGVDISISAKIMLNYVYERTMFYEIREIDK